MANEHCYILNNGLTVPCIGLGTMMASDHETEITINVALRAGYRRIDTAPVYLNEKAIGRVLKKWLDSNQIKREDLFITTKLPTHGNRPSCVERMLKQSLEDLQLSYVDMYLIHTPFAMPEPTNTIGFPHDKNGNLIIDSETDLVKIWQKMEEMVELGLSKSIGISNFNEKQIQRLLDNCKIKPSNLQVEVHLYFQQKDLVDYCKSKDIAVTAYSPLGSGEIDNKDKITTSLNKIPKVLSDLHLLQIAKIHKKSPAQILLRWIVQRGICAIPRSTNLERLQQNLNIFDFILSKEEMSILSKADKGIRICDFGSFKGLEKHPEFPW